MCFGGLEIKDRSVTGLVPKVQPRELSQSVTCPRSSKQMWMPCCFFGSFIWSLTIVDVIRTSPSNNNAVILQQWLTLMLYVGRAFTCLPYILKNEGIFNVWPYVMVVWRSRADHWLALSPMCRTHGHKLNIAILTCHFLCIIMSKCP